LTLLLIRIYSPRPPIVKDRAPSEDVLQIMQVDLSSTAICQLILVILVLLSLPISYKLWSHFLFSPDSTKHKIVVWGQILWKYLNINTNTLKIWNTKYKCLYQGCISNTNTNTSKSNTFTLILTTQVTQPPNTSLL